jgi:hypothetical protein
LSRQSDEIVLVTLRHRKAPVCPAKEFNNFGVRHLESQLAYKLFQAFIRRASTLPAPAR